MEKEAIARMTMKMPLAELTAQQRKPFLRIMALYGLIGSMVMLGFTPEPYSALIWFLVFYVLACANLFFLSKGVAVTLNLMSHQGTEKGPNTAFHLFFYGTMKLLLLGAIFFLIWKNDTASMLAKMMGLGTMVAVPLFGGFWLSQLENRERPLGASGKLVLGK